jgi:hypothetical protein
MVTSTGYHSINNQVSTWKQKSKNEGIKHSHYASRKHDVFIGHVIDNCVLKGEK